MSFILGLPRCNEPPHVFAATLRGFEESTLRPARVVIIDNGDAPLEDLPSGEVPREVLRQEKNIGCAGAWNKLAGIAFSEGSPLVICNGDCAVAPDTFRRLFELPPPALVCAIGFSCYRLDASIYEKVGPFDEEYYPVYWEDTDYRYRCKLAGIEIIEWPTVEASRPEAGRATYGTGVTHGWDVSRGYQGWTGEKLAWFYRCYDANKRRYIDKWGGEVGHERFTTPFGAAIT